MEKSVHDIIDEIFNGKDSYAPLKDYFDGSRIAYDDLLYLYELARIYRLNKDMNIENNKNQLIYNIFRTIKKSKINQIMPKIIINMPLVEFNDESDICYYNLLYTIIKSAPSLDAFRRLLNKSLDILDTSTIILTLQLIVKHGDFCDVVNSNDDLSKKKYYILCDVTRCFEFEPDSEKQIEDFIKSNSATLQYNNDTEESMKFYRQRFLMYHNLDDRSANFLYLSNYIKDVLDKLPTADYSVCTLQYYKVVEIEIKRQILCEAIKNLNSEIIFNNIKERKETSNNIPLKYYSKDWIESMSLGNIHYLLKDYCKYIENKHFKNENNYPLELSKFYDNIFSIIPSYKVITMLLNTTHHSMIQKFRNPPAHTNPCGIKECELAEDIVTNFLWGIVKLDEDSDWLKIDSEIFDEVIGDEKFKEDNIQKYYSI